MINIDQVGDPESDQISRFFLILYSATAVAALAAAAPMLSTWQTHWKI